MKENFASDLRTHGPLSSGEEIQINPHQEVTIYIVDGGSALLEVGTFKIALGVKQQYNKVLFPNNDQCVFTALTDGVVIYEIFGGFTVFIKKT